MTEVCLILEYLPNKKYLEKYLEISEKSGNIFTYYIKTMRQVVGPQLTPKLFDLT